MKFSPPLVHNCGVEVLAIDPKLKRIYFVAHVVGTIADVNSPAVLQESGRKVIKTLNYLDAEGYICFNDFQSGGWSTQTAIRLHPPGDNLQFA